MTNCCLHRFVSGSKNFSFSEQINKCNSHTISFLSNAVAHVHIECALCKTPVASTFTFSYRSTTCGEYTSCCTSQTQTPDVCVCFHMYVSPNMLSDVAFHTCTHQTMCVNGDRAKYIIIQAAWFRLPRNRFFCGCCYVFQMDSQTKYK